MKRSIQGPSESDRKHFAGLVLPYLDYLYDFFIFPTLKRHNLIVTVEFWNFLSLGIFATIIYFTELSAWVPITFLIGAALVLLLHNNSYIRRKVFPKKTEEVKCFLDDVDKKSIEEISEFVTAYSLDVKQLQRVLVTRHKNNRDLYILIYQNQQIKAELLDYMFDNRLYACSGGDVFAKYILMCKDRLGKRKYAEMVKEFRDDVCIAKALNVQYYFYAKCGPIFRFFCWLQDYVRRGVNYGSGKALMFMIGFLFSALLSLKALQTDSSPKTISVGAAVFIVVVITGVVIAGLLMGILKIVLNGYRRILFLVAPHKCP